MTSQQNGQVGVSAQNRVEEGSLFEPEKLTSLAVAHLANMRLSQSPRAAMWMLAPVSYFLRPLSGVLGPSVQQIKSVGARVCRQGKEAW